MARSLKCRKKKRDCTICVAKTKGLISCAVPAQLICAFVFAYACCRLSHPVAHLFQEKKDKSMMSSASNTVIPEAPRSVSVALPGQQKPRQITRRNPLKADLVILKIFNEII